MAWGSQMQKTYYGDNYWVSTWTVWAVRCIRLFGQWQRKPIHISRIQGVLRNLPNKAHNHTAISPKIKRPGWTFCRHVKASPQKKHQVLRRTRYYSNFCRYTESPPIPIHHWQSHQFARKIRSVFDKLLPKQNMLRRTTLPLKKMFNLGEKNYLKKYQNNTFCWERGKILKRIGNMVYIVEGPQ